jgi:hypothetical protein
MPDQQRSCDRLNSTLPTLPTLPSGTHCHARITDRPRDCNRITKPPSHLPGLLDTLTQRRHRTYCAHTFTHGVRQQVRRGVHRKHRVAQVVRCSHNLITRQPAKTIVSIPIPCTRFHRTPPDRAKHHRADLYDHAQLRVQIITVFG